MKIRNLNSSDSKYLEELIYHAIFIPSGEEKPDRTIIFNPDVYVYIEYFGQESDTGVVAEVDGELVGGAWTRIINGYGSIDDKTPELAISIIPEFRGQGVGTELINALFERLIKKGYKKTSLAVQKENPAVRFYLRLGYKIVRTNDEEYIMVKDLI